MSELSEDQFNAELIKKLETVECVFKYLMDIIPRHNYYINTSSYSYFGTPLYMEHERLDNENEENRKKLALESAIAVVFGTSEEAKKAGEKIRKMIKGGA